MARIRPRRKVPPPPSSAPSHGKKRLGELAFASMAEDCAPAKALARAGKCTRPRLLGLWIARAVPGILAPFGCPRTEPWQRRCGAYLFVVGASELGGPPAGMARA